MSKKQTIDWIIPGKKGTKPDCIKVVYYSSDETCPACKGSGSLPFDNRASFNGKMEPSPMDEDCYHCFGTGTAEKIDRARMSEEQSELFERYMKCLRDSRDRHDEQVVKSRIKETEGWEEERRLKEEDRY